METFFASPKRSPKEQLDIEISIACGNPLMSCFLNSLDGLIAVLNEHRQVLALNAAFLTSLGIDDPEEVLGLRPGEALHCIHADEEPAGCGTTRFCSSCGAAIAIVASLEQDMPAERLCALTANRGGKHVDTALLVRSHPIKIDNNRFLLVFAQDVTADEHRAALERTFFHDINNLLCGLLQTCESLLEEQSSELSETVNELAQRLTGEVAIQRCLLRGESGRYHPTWSTASVGDVVGQLERFFANHQAARGKKIEYAPCPAELMLSTDLSALSRVLINMTLNALEATESNGTVKFWTESENENVSFCVWNNTHIPKEVQQRLFQRNFSTKAQDGRGIGTYSMKLLGQEVLGGQISVASSEAAGTTFSFQHPVGEINL